MLLAALAAPSLERPFLFLMFLLAAYAAPSLERPFLFLMFLLAAYAAPSLERPPGVHFYFVKDRLVVPVLKQID